MGVRIGTRSTNAVPSSSRERPGWAYGDAHDNNNVGDVRGRGPLESIELPYTRTSGTHQRSIASETRPVLGRASLGGSRISLSADHRQGTPFLPSLFVISSLLAWTL